MKSGFYCFVEKLKIVEKNQRKLNCSYGQVIHTLKNIKKTIWAGRLVFFILFYFIFFFFYYKFFLFFLFFFIFLLFFILYIFLLFILIYKILRKTETTKCHLNKY